MFCPSDMIQSPGRRWGGTAVDGTGHHVRTPAGLRHA